MKVGDLVKFSSNDLPLRLPRRPAIAIIIESANNDDTVLYLVSYPAGIASIERWHQKYWEEV